MSKVEQTPNWLQNLNRLAKTDRGDLLFLNLGQERLEILTDSVLKRNYEIARMARELVSPEYTVIMPQSAISTEGLSSERRKRGLHDRAIWVYGSILPRELLRRSTKIQVHPPLPGDDIPEWFDLEFPKRIQDTVLPGYSCFTGEKLTEATLSMLDEFAQVRLKNPRGASGEDQTVVASREALDRFLRQKQVQYESDGGFEQFLREYGYVVEANLSDVEAWSFTLTTTPRFNFTSIGRLLEAPARQPDGSVIMEYGGTSSVTIIGGPESFYDMGLPDEVIVDDPLRNQVVISPDDVVVSVAENHINAMREWEREGIVRTRANIDVLRGTLVYQNGERKRVTASVEDSGRAGGASPAELLSALELISSTDCNYVLHSTRHVFNREQAKVYKEYIDETEEGVIFWNGVDETWGGKYVLFCVF
ncbi:MAG: DUF3182 family protein [Chloroflexota bacterium]|nr:DUF3182 family protein [Chloroflexota bacterium]